MFLTSIWSRISPKFDGYYYQYPIPVPLAYHTFGGWKKSVFGDLNQHGPDAFKFYTRTKTVTARWPSGTKEGGEFSIPIME